jgi:hypothetical protein
LLGGIYLAAAVLLKVFPVLLLAYFVWQRRWVFVASTLVAMAVGAFLLPAMVWGWQRNLTYLREWTSKVGAPSVESEAERAENPLYSQLHSSYLPRNQSLKAVLARLTHQPNAPYGAGVGAVMLVVTAVIAWRQRADLNPLLLLSAAVVWTLLISPVSWSHYFMLLLLPLTVLLATQTLPARIALIVFGVAGFVAAGNKTLQGYGLLCWGTFGLWVALMVLLTRRSTGMCCE